jgi:hypothetical protein
MFIESLHWLPLFRGNSSTLRSVPPCPRLDVGHAEKFQATRVPKAPERLKLVLHNENGELYPRKNHEAASDFVNLKKFTTFGAKILMHHAPSRLLVWSRPC